MIHRFSQSGDRPQNALVHQYSTRSDVEKQFPLIQVHDPESADIAYAVGVAEEMINISGALTTVYARTENAVDEVWEEDANPTYYSGKKLKGFFVPQPISAQLTPWGVDAPNQTTVVFSRKAVIEIFAERMIRVGDVMELAYDGAALQPRKYRVLNAFDSGNFRYTWLYFNCLVETIADDITIDIDHK